MCLIGMDDDSGISSEVKIRQVILSRKKVIFWSTIKIGALESFSWRKQVMQHYPYQIASEL